MGEENTSTMNLDLNLGPVDNLMNLREWLDSGRHRNQRWISFWRQPGNEERSFFDCNICLDTSKDPVVTCCGHLFCWTCLYRWLHHHSDAKECPVCKGEVTTKNVTPIYGRGNTNTNTNTQSNLKIPVRPHARRVESWRQTIQRSMPMEQMIRRLGTTFDFGQDLDAPPPPPPPLERTSSGSGINNNNISLLNRILTSRGMRRVPLAEDVIHLTTAEDNNNNSDTNNSRQISSLLLRRSSTHRALQSGLMSVESYFDNNAAVEMNMNVDDRDSVSSIAAIIQSESQTVDTAVEIDSTLSSSRRRADVDSEDSRAPRRMRFN